MLAAPVPVETADDHRVGNITVSGLPCAASEKTTGVAPFLLERGSIMPGRGPQTFKKRQKEQQRKERQQEKAMKRLERKELRASLTADEQKDAAAATSTEQETEPDVDQSSSFVTAKN